MNVLCRPVSYIRLYSTTPSPIRSTKLIETLLHDTRQPIWGLLKSLRSPYRSEELSSALEGHNVSSDEFRRWKPVLSEPNLSSAVDLLKSRGIVVHPMHNANSTVEHLPSWLVLYLIAYKIRTHQQAAVTSMDLTYSHLTVATTPIQGPLLIFTLLSLARFNLLVPIRQVVDTFLTINLDHPALYFNLLLQAFSCLPTRSVESASPIVSILKTMQSRQLQLSSSTYQMLLNDRFVTLELTKRLRAQMIHEGFVPKAEHLEAYLRIFAKNGAIYSAANYRRAIRSSVPLPPPVYTSFSDDPVNRADTLFLSASEDRASSFNFLYNLLEPVPPNPSNHLYLPAPLQRRTLKELDKYGYTAALALEARDHNVSDVDLIRTFERIQTRFKPTVVTHTVLIRGLLRRKSPLTAKQWDAFCNSGLTLDKHSLALGLQVLTRDGKPHLAFSLLETFAGRGTEGTNPQQKPITLTSVSINDFLVALNRIGRPDVVFRLWDQMGELYGVFPDARSLSILLQAARLARRLDDSLSGAIAHLSLKNPFRHEQPETSSAFSSSRPPSTSVPTVLTTSPPTPRYYAVASITSILGTPSTGLHPYKALIWHNQIPSDTAITIFYQALVGNAPQHKLTPLLHLTHTPPAQATRASVHEDPGLGLRFFFGQPHIRRSGGGGSPSLPVPDKLFTPDGRSRYPHIVVTNENCLNGIVLLGLTSRAGEIPMVLAWMREVGVKPSEAMLAVALVFWEEVSVQAPLVERWVMHGEEKSEYVRLREWMKEWVGERRMPSERMLGLWHQKVVKMRSASG